VIVKVAGATTSDRVTDFVCAGFSASATVAVRLAVPAAVGVPEIIPLDAARVSPAGRLPETDHVYGEAPPVACSTVEYEVPTVPEGSDVVAIAND
jgi:hypothetical protein